MADGRIVERGAHRELIAADTLYRRMFGAAQVEAPPWTRPSCPAGAGRRSRRPPPPTVAAPARRRARAR